ncbi:unnamed protein product [Trichobilharzia szidati]|nr:unnamed protein product [Trichobilharzia szidati]
MKNIIGEATTQDLPVTAPKTTEEVEEETTTVNIDEEENEYG